MTKGEGSGGPYRFSLCTRNSIYMVPHFWTAIHVSCFICNIFWFYGLWLMSCLHLCR